jgi:hypothetical protein
MSPPLSQVDVGLQQVNSSSNPSLGTLAQDEAPELNVLKQRFLLLCVDTMKIGATGKYLVRLSNIDVASKTVWND